MAIDLDLSKLSMRCENCGAVVSPEIDEYVTDVYADPEPSGSFLRWTSEKCGHVRISAISAGISGEQIEQLERQEESRWNRCQDDE